MIIKSHSIILETNRNEMLMNQTTFRMMNDNYPERIYEAFRKQGWEKATEQYNKYEEEQTRL
ncbi:hypothetical protein PMSD_18710 [Paenibacillus macquariensis subsp. defensor]|nr:hypothetical protein PMSD_18710 [Paenibacillus macquariensis subsp. defensor]